MVSESLKTSQEEVWLPVPLARTDWDSGGGQRYRDRTVTGFSTVAICSVVSLIYLEHFNLFFCTLDFWRK